MKSINLSALLFFCLLISIGLISGCGGDSGTEPNGTEQQLPKSGEWTATADFGSFDFTVNATSSAITEINYHFSSWSCGGVTLSGGVGISSSSGWAIADGQFIIENDLDISGDQTMTLAGSFGDSGDTASGTCVAVMYGTTCTGNWQASPVN